MEENKEKMAKLYEVVEKSTQTPPPKRALFGAKCPKCGSKLSKNTMKAIAYTGDTGPEFARKAAARVELPVGLYNLTIKHYACKQCGYEYAAADMVEPNDPSA